MASGQAISVTKLEEVKNEHLRAGSCSISSTGPGRSAMGTERRNQRWRQGAGEGILAKRGSFPGDQVMPGKDLQSLAWDPPGTLVLSSLLHETTLYL